MNSATAVKRPASFHAIQRPIVGASIFTVTGPEAIAIHAATWIGDLHLQEDTQVALPDLVAGTDYAVRMIDGTPVAVSCGDTIPEDAIGGFHFAPGGNAAARTGGDAVPAINPFSCWDAGFRPACPDPRGMAIVDLSDGARIWVDIYKLGVDHVQQGTSRFGVTIADGRDLPRKIDGDGNYTRLDYGTAVEIYTHHGKQLLSYDEFRAAAFGVTEKTAAPRDPKTTGLDVARTSQRGIMQATGNLWDWGHDGDPDNSRASVFGGSWIHGDLAGSRYADLDCWPGRSAGGISARGRSDHLSPA